MYKKWYNIKIPIQIRYEHGRTDYPILSDLLISHQTPCFFNEKFSNSNVSGRTGRGDTTFAAYLSRRLTYDVAESLKFAAALVSIKMETPGPFSGTLEDVMQRIKEKHS